MARQKQLLAVIAHDEKADMLAWATYNRGLLAQHDLIATASTGELLRDKVGWPRRICSSRRR